MRKVSPCHSNILHIVGLEESIRKHTEESREELVNDETRERDLSQSEESKDEETVKFRSIHSIYDETNLMCSESYLFSAEKPSTYS